MKKSFTLIEVLLYIAIVTIMMSALVLFAWNAIILGAKNNTQQELYAQGRIVSERILAEIRNANGINSVSASQISLIENAPNDPTIINVSAGILMIKQGVAAAVPLHSNTITVNSLVFTDYSSADGKTKNIGYVLQVSRNSTNVAQQYKGTITIESGAEVRSNPL